MNGSRFLKILCCGLCLLWTPVVQAGPVQAPREIQRDTALDVSPEQGDTLPVETDHALQEYRDVLRREAQLRLYNDQIARMIAAQEAEMASFEQQRAEIEETHREIVPLMIRMIDRLGQFVTLDRPFLRAERLGRVEALRKLMERADVSFAEKYRRVMAAYEVEAAYGRTIEASTGRLDREGNRRSVHFLRIGRLALFYLSLDGTEAGYWDAREKSWKTLPKDYLRSIEQGLRIAKKEAPPDLLRLPIPAPEFSK